MKIAEASEGQSYWVRRISLETETERRLEMLGMTEGAAVTVLSRHTNGDAIVKVRGTRLAIGKKIADGIEIGSDPA